MTLLFGPDGSEIVRPEDVKQFLGKPYHWRVGRSAYEAAQSWWRAQDLPHTIRALIDTDRTFSNAVLTKAIFEKQTDLGTPGNPSQTDVLAFVMSQAVPAILGVEAKVDEPFGQLVSVWDDQTLGKQLRLQDLQKRLGLKGDIAELRYQLLHRTVAVMIEAQEHGVQNAAMVVQSFSPAEIRAGFSDFQEFAQRLGAPVEAPGRLSAPVKRGGIRLWLGWVQDRLYGS